MTESVRADVATRPATGQNAGTKEMEKHQKTSDAAKDEQKIIANLKIEIYRGAQSFNTRSRKSSE